MFTSELTCILNSNKNLGEVYWDDFRITKNQPVGPVYLRIANHLLKNDLPMQLLLTIVPEIKKQLLKL